MVLARVVRLLRRLLQLPRRAGRMVRAERRAIARAKPVIPGTVFYESFGGNGALDNPEAIFRALLDDPDFAGFRHVWALERGTGRTFRAEFARHPRVRFVHPRTVAYTAALSRSQSLVNNATFPPEFQKRDGQTYLNTWHGTPLKRMGYDMPGGAFDSANTLRNFVHADVLLSQNPHMTRMYTEAYRLKGLLPGVILEAGYPRTDRQRLDVEGRAAALTALQAAGIHLGDRSLVLYAPTWKGTDFGSPVDEAVELEAATAGLQELLGDDYLVVLKVHQAVHKAMVRTRRGSGGTGSGVGATSLIPNDLPTNVALGLADVLITDYSSIFVDFLGTGRPVVFYTPDRDDYARERGTYFDEEGLPGVVATTVPQLAAAILQPTPAEVTAVADRWRRDFTSRDDGHATARVIDAVFRGGLAAGPISGTVTTELMVPASPRRPSVLIYVGGMRSNGITTSALNLLAHLDHDALEVSVLMARPSNREQRANAARIDSQVVQFHRRGELSGRRAATLTMRALGRLRPRHPEAEWESRIWRNEWRRVMGDTTFDTVIDFSGYSRFWTQLVLHSPPARRLIWLHNDMAAEVNRRVGGRRKMRWTLPSVFALYARFDRLVSVSQQLAMTNAESLAESYGLPRDHFLSAGNVIDEVSARRMLQQPLSDAVEFRDLETEEVTVPDWAEHLIQHRGTPGNPERWFATVGRLSPEKNQARLIDAFALVHPKYPSARLVIVGDGPLRAALAGQIERLGLGNAVVMTGSLANPFAVLAVADCFVMSSDYEGQPMVLLEAAVAGLPIVSVRFGSVADALPEGQLHIVEQTAEALAQGMCDYLEGRVTAASLDAEEYNAGALRDFLTAIGQETTASVRRPAS
jgi:CDP-glycerol glycerophosphotransferase (TagB/SpsB family)/glycosyltransferase involved in cell wall biosynthesis